MQPTVRFAEALTYASQLHAEQRRKSSDIPYIAHLLAVTALVLEHGADEDEAIAALLHDAIEDQGGRAGARWDPTPIWNACGRDRRPAAPIPTQCPNLLGAERKESYLARLRNANRSVRLVVAADKLHNVRSLIGDYRALGELLWSRFSGGKTGTLWYYRNRGRRVGRGGSQCTGH